MTMSRTCRQTSRLLLAAGAALAATSAAFAQPANDLCTAAQVVSAGSTTPASNVGATSDVATASCAFTPTDDLDVWFSFTAPSDGLYVFDTNGSTGLTDTTISLFDTCGGTELACDDDTGTGLLSQVSYSMTASQTVLVRVAGWNHGTGAFQLNVSNPILPAGNDECANAVAVAPASSTAGDNLSASGADITSCGGGDTQDVWYVLTTTTAGVYVIDTQGSALDTTLAVFDSCGGSELACNDDSNGLQSAVSVSLGAAVQAYIRVAGYGGATGTFTLNVSSPMTPTGNDECTSAIAVSPGSVNPGSNLGATGTDLTSCAFGDTADVWFVLTTTSAGFYQIDTLGSTMDTSLAVFDACGGIETACNDDSGSLQSLVNVQLGAGVQVYIRVAGYNGATGTFTLNVGNPVVPPAPPANDDCAAATVIAGLPFADSSTDISGATDDADLASCNNVGAVVTPQGVWYTYTPAASERFRARLNGTLATFLSVFTGSCGGGFTEVTGACGRNVLVDGAAGTTYYILVGASGTGGLPPTAVINLTVEPAPPPANDDCSAAVAITPGSTTFGDNTNSSGTDITSCSPGDVTDVWYSLSITTAATYVIDTEGSTGLTDTALSIFDSCGGAEIVCDDDGGTGFLSRIETALNPGTYLVRVAGYGGAQGAFQLNVSDVVLPPSNDTCAGAVPITAVPSTFNGTSLGATSDLASSSCAFTPTDDRDVWFSFSPPATDFYVFDTEGSTGLTDTTVSAFDACFGTEIGCNDDDGTGLLSRLNISLNAGTTYYIRVAGWNHTSGDFTLNVSVGAPPPAGDDCSGAVVVTSPSTTTGDTTTFTSQLASSSCGFGDNIDAWFSFTPATTASYIIDTLGSDALGMDDTTLSIFDACGGNEIACNEDIDLDGGNYLSSIETTLNAGTTYYIRVAGFGGLTGGFQLNIAGGASSDGACCSGSTCSIGTAATCTGVNTSFAGVGTVCNVFGVNNTTPCCLADYNHSGTVTVQDIFDFLSGYFTANLAADINASGSVTVQDIFDFLSAYFTGC